MAMDQTSPEYSTTVECTSLLCNSIKGSVEDIGAALFSNGYLSEAESESTLLPGVEPSKKALTIISIVRAKVKCNPEVFKNFVDILKNQGEWMKDCIDELTKCYETNKLKMASSSDQSVGTSAEANRASFICPFCQKCTMQDFFMNRCPKATKSSVKSPSFPFLDTSKLSEKDKCILEEKLISDFKKTENKYCGFQVSMVESCTEFPIEKLRVFLLGKNIFTVEEVAKLERANSISDILVALYTHTSFFHYELIELIINEFGSAEDKQKLQEYLTVFNTYCERNVFEVPHSVFHPQIDKEENAAFALKYSQEHPVPLKQVKSLCQNIASILQIDPWALRLISIEDGCVLFKFAIPKAVAANVLPISPLQQEALSAFGLKVTPTENEQHKPTYSMKVSFSAYLTTNPGASQHSLSQIIPATNHECTDKYGYEVMDPPHGRWSQNLYEDVRVESDPDYYYSSQPRPGRDYTGLIEPSAPSRYDLPLQPPARRYRQPPPPPPAKPSSSPTGTHSRASPSGYRVMELFSKGNILFLVPEESQKQLPLTTSGKTVQGGGSYSDDSKFEVTIPRVHSSESVIALRSVKHSERYLCIDSKGKIKACNGYKDKCDFFVSVVGSESSPVVCFESAKSDGLYLGIKADNHASDTRKITAEFREAHFTIRADRILPSTRQSKLQVFKKGSIMNNIKDRCVIRLFSHRRYLSIDAKGRVNQTHNKENLDCFFTVFDRGMGMVSLRSYKYVGYWLRMQGDCVMGKGVLGPDAFFNVKETPDQFVCFESVMYPGTFLIPPVKNTSTPPPSPEFIVEIPLLKAESES